MNHDYGERNTGEVLLIFEVAIKRQEKIKLPRGKLQQFHRFSHRQPRLGNGLYIVAKKLLTESAWNALVKQHAHQRSSGPSPVRGQQQQFLA
jgi:Holliday junction resolvase